MRGNALYYGDNLDVLRRHIKDETVDLVYLDPPFKSDQDYNLLFAERDGTKARAQIKAFNDTWRWDIGAAGALEELIERGGRVSQAMQAMRLFLGESDVLAYLAMMAPRLLELRRVMKPTASIYLHCDPTASHYLKLLMDAVFGPTNFLNEVTWKRTHAHGNVGRNYGSVCDTLLVYHKGPAYAWNQPYVPFAPNYVDRRFTGVDADGRRWQSVTLRNPSPRPNLRYVFTTKTGVSYKPHPNGWAVGPDRMEQYDREGRLHFPRKPGGQLRLKMYLDESPGMKVTNLWEDIFPVNSQAQERIHYPTQKPKALLERIIRTSSSEGDTILDPFCGCGTAIEVAEQLNRKWIGIDITYLAIAVIKKRLKDAFPGRLPVKAIGEPVDYTSAEALAADDPYQFQIWILGLVGARPAEQKKGADQGVDGRLLFHDDKSGRTKQAVFSVKAGLLHAHHVRDLRGVIERERAELGALLSMKKPTTKMRREAAAAGFYTSPLGTRHPRLQLLTVEELLAGRGLDYPSAGQRIDATYRRTPKAEVARAEQGELALAPARRYAGAERRGSPGRTGPRRPRVR